MAIITSGTPIRKVLSGGTPITKVVSNGTVIWTNIVLITITIPAITGVATQTLKIGTTTIYSGAGGTTVQVEHGSSVIISATAATGYFVNVTSPVKANADFSTVSYITVTDIRQNNPIYSFGAGQGKWRIRSTYAVASALTVSCTAYNNTLGVTYYPTFHIPQGSTNSTEIEPADTDFESITDVQPYSDSTYYYTY